MGQPERSSELRDSQPVFTSGFYALEPTELPPGVIEHREEKFVGARSVSLFGQRWRPRSKVHGVVVVVHGMKDHSSRYSAFAEVLVERGFAVHAFDLRGHGRSGGVRTWVDSFDDYVADLDLFVRRVRVRENGAPVFVFGHGMGAAIAALWTIRRGRAPAGLVLSGAALQPRMTGRHTRTVNLVGTVAPRVRIFQMDVRRASRDRSTVEDALRDGLVHQAPAPARTGKELFTATRAIDKEASEIRVPLLVMHGSRDAFSDPEGSRRLVARASSAEKEFYLYDGLAHDLLHEPERRRVMCDAGEWLEQRLGS